MDPSSVLHLWHLAQLEVYTTEQIFFQRWVFKSEQYSVLGLHSFRTSAVIQTPRKQNRLQGFKPTLPVVLCFYSFMQKALNSKTSGVKEVNGIDLSNCMNIYNVEMIDFFFPQKYKDYYQMSRGQVPRHRCMWTLIRLSLMCSIVRNNVIKNSNRDFKK